jgi:hypothetical protein
MAGRQTPQPARPVRTPPSATASGKDTSKALSAKPAACAVGPPRASLALEQIEALTREQQRIERRSLILGYAVATLDSVPLRDALAELLADINEAARTIGAIVQPVASFGRA